MNFRWLLTSCCVFLLSRWTVPFLRTPLIRTGNQRCVWSCHVKFGLRVMPWSPDCKSAFIRCILKTTFSKNCFESTLEEINHLGSLVAEMPCLIRRLFVSIQLMHGWCCCSLLVYLMPHIRQLSSTWCYRIVAPKYLKKLDRSYH